MAQQLRAHRRFDAPYSGSLTQMRGNTASKLFETLHETLSDLIFHKLLCNNSINDLLQYFPSLLLFLFYSAFENIFFGIADPIRMPDARTVEKYAHRYVGNIFDMCIFSNRQAFCARYRANKLHRQNISDDRVLF